MPGCHQILSKDCRLPPSLSICGIYSIRNTLKRWIRGIISGPKSRSADPLGRDSLVATSAALNAVMHGTSDHRNQPFKSKRGPIDESMNLFATSNLPNQTTARKATRRDGPRSPFFPTRCETHRSRHRSLLVRSFFRLLKLSQQPKRLRSSGDRQFHRRTQHTSLCRRD